MKKQTFHKYVDKLGKGILYDKHFSTLEEAISYVGATSEEDLKENFRVKKYVNSAGCQGYSIILKVLMNMKTVKQFIEELQKLNQDKSIWIYYGHCGDYFEPDINIATGEEFVSTVAEEIHKNDYIILV